MRKTRIIAMLLALTGAVSAQNPPAPKTAGRTSASAVDNEHIRVTKVTQQPHQKTRPHQHNMNRVMVYLTPGTQVNDYQEGKKEVLDFQAGDALWSASGGIHVAEVTSAAPITIVEMELRRPTGRGAAGPLDPVQVDGRHYRVEMENAQVRVIRVKVGAGESLPLHEHGRDRVTVYLTDQDSRVTGADGSAVVQTRKAGDIAWSGAARHRVENRGGAFEAVIVELK